MTMKAYAFLQSRRIAQARRKKESLARRRNPHCQQCAKPFLTTCDALHRPNVLAADASWTQGQPNFCQSSAKSTSFHPNRLGDEFQKFQTMQKPCQCMTRWQGSEFVMCSDQKLNDARTPYVRGGRSTE